MLSNQGTNTTTKTEDQIMDAATEKALLVDLKAGLPEAVKQWFQIMKPHLTAFVGAKIDNAKDRDELVQEVFLHSLKQLPLFRGESSLWTWMCSIARHEIADYYRKKYAKKALKTLPLMDWLVHDMGHDLTDETPCDASELAEVVRATLSHMTPRYRALLLGKYLDEFSVKELALRHDKSEKSIESDLFRARREFKDLWTQVPI